MRLNSKSLTQEIKVFGSKLGFNQVGIAPPDASLWGERFLHWLDRGFEGEMRYMARDAARRTDPGAIFPGVRSVVVVSMNYYPGEHHRECLQDPAAGYIANYALHEDYHPLITSKLTQLLQYIRSLTNGKVQGKIYVDTGPVSEKALAVMAGVGWMGKHSLLIGQDTGSWLLLGVLLLDAELDFDEPVRDQCGDCVACMKACPTQAILSPYVVDARRCISYLLGELKGVIPVEMRPLIGNRVFGCDDCQWACPYNKGTAVSTETSFVPRKELTFPRLIALMEMGAGDFKGLFYKNPVLRVKRNRFLRNVAVALGNSGDQRAVPDLEKRLNDPDITIREHVEWAINRLLKAQ